MSSPVLVPQDSSLADAIASTTQVKMVLLGSAGRAAQIADWAMQIAGNGLQPSGINVRTVIWIQAAPVPHDATFGPEPYPTVAVLDRSNTLTEAITDDGSNIDPLTLELMFLNAGA
jgi:hypothetical protein